MANTPDNMDKRRKRREAQRRKQKMQRRRLRLGLLAAVVLLGLCGGALYYFTQSVPAEQLSSVTDRQMEATEAPTEAPTEATRAPHHHHSHSGSGRFEHHRLRGGLRSVPKWL